jgi:hypothetical protein
VSIFWSRSEKVGLENVSLCSRGLLHILFIIYGIIVEQFFNFLGSHPIPKQFVPINPTHNIRVESKPEYLIVDICLFCKLHFPKIYYFLNLQKECCISASKLLMYCKSHKKHNQTKHKVENFFNKAFYADFFRTTKIKGNFI